MSKQERNPWTNPDGTVSSKRDLYVLQSWTIRRCLNWRKQTRSVKLSNVDAAQYIVFQAATCSHLRLAFYSF